jgi:FkbM family methyltransferase
VSDQRRIERVNKVLSVPPFRYRPVRKGLLRGRRAVVRQRRRREERRGSDRLSRPSLHGMEQRLADYLPEHGGVFVEAGAFDGYEQSNTYWLERFRGWSGVLVEPVPELYRETLRNRPGAKVFNCALVPSDHDTHELTMRYGGLASIVPGAQGGDAADDAHLATAFEYKLEEPYDFTVPARTLTSVLEEAKVGDIDLLSLDVEGYEPQVLRGLDLDRFAPRLMLIELLDMERKRSEVDEVIGDRYEWVCQVSPNDGLYRLKTATPS